MTEPSVWRRYAPWLGAEPDPILGITNPSFQEYRIETPHGVEHAQSMLSIFEIALLYGCCRHSYLGEGVIVDSGPLLGVGTYAMARGLVHNAEIRDRNKRIYSFDLWLGAGLGDYFMALAGPTGSVFERFLEINRDYLDEIYPSPGDLLSMKWADQPIEILFVDISKSLELNAWVLRNWFTNLIPGKSVLIQQDYVYFAQWWIAVTMEFFRDCFELTEFVYGASAVYRCAKPISAAQVESFLRLSRTEHAVLMREAIRNAPPSVAEVLKCGLAALLIGLDNEESDRVLNSVRTEVKHSDPVQDFSEIAQSNVEVVRRLLYAEKQPR